MKKYTADDIEILDSDQDIETLIDLSLEGFSKNLNEACILSRDFTRELIYENLPDNMQYLVCLGASYDGNELEPGEVTFPEDYDEPERFFDNQCDVVNLLWRNGFVPEWINVQVYKQDENFTYIMLTCCGRFSDVKSNIYHAHEGKAPFHSLGPPMPFECDDDERFSLYWQKNA